MRNRKAVILLLTANAISGISQGLTIMAVPWYFIHIAQKESLYGIMFAIITALTLVWSLYAGTLVDRYSRKKVFLGLNVGGFIVMATLATIGMVSGELNDFLVITAYASTILLFNVHYPTLYAFGQEITEKKNYGKINSLIEVVGQSTTMIAGAAAAFLLGGTMDDFPLKEWIPLDIEPWAIQEIFLLDAITYGIAIVLIAMIKYTPIEPLKIDTTPLKQRLKAGFRYLKENVPLFWFGIASYAVFIAFIVQAFYLMQMYVSNHLDEKAWVFASAEMLYAFGAILAGLFIRKIFKKVHELKAILILMVVTSTIFLILGFTQAMVIFFGFNLLVGLTNAGIRILRFTFLFNRIPNNMIGRANSIFNALNIATRVFFLSLFSITFFTEGSNVAWAYMILGIFLLLATIPIFRHFQVLKEPVE